MPKTYQKADESVAERATAIMRKHYSELAKVKLHIDFIFVSSPDGHALMHQGYPADAVISIVGPKERALGNGDVKIVIDELLYLAMNDDEKNALLDHEIHHVELKYDKHGQLKRDEHNRPKLRMKKHDVQVGRFVAIAERHGVASGEVKQASRIFIEHKQTLFAFVGNDQKALAGAV